MHGTRQKVFLFLQSQPGWHDSFEIAAALNISKPAAMNQCECLRSLGYVECQKALGQSAKNLYQIKEGAIAPPSSLGRPVTGNAKIKVTIRLPQDLVEWIDQRGDKTSVIEAALKNFKKTVNTDGHAAY